jgi:hypothetical protein
VGAFAAGLPGRHLTIVLLWRGAILWLLGHAAVGVGAVVVPGASVQAGLHSLGGVGSPLLIAVVVALGLMEVARLNEDRFLANLGVSSVVTALLLAVPALLGEIVLGVLHG